MYFDFLLKRVKKIKYLGNLEKHEKNIFIVLFYLLDVLRTERKLVI